VKTKKTYPNGTVEEKEVTETLVIEKCAHSGKLKIKENNDTKENKISGWFNPKKSNATFADITEGYPPITTADMPINAYMDAIYNENTGFLDINFTTYGPSFPILGGWTESGPWNLSRDVSAPSTGRVDFTSPLSGTFEFNFTSVFQAENIVPEDGIPMKGNMTLYGSFRIITHDIAIMDMTTTKTVVGQGFTVDISVTTFNYGLYDENFALSVFANDTEIATQTVTLTSGNSTVVSYVWDSGGFVKGNYTVWALAWPVPDETDKSDNTFSNCNVIVVMVGDVNADGIVEMMDFFILSQHYMHFPPDGHMIGTARYHECFNADVNSDGSVEMMDFYYAAQNYMKTDP
jgi:hypothetical protein